MTLKQLLVFSLFYVSLVHSADISLSPQCLVIDDKLITSLVKDMAPKFLQELNVKILEKNTVTEIEAKLDKMMLAVCANEIEVTINDPNSTEAEVIEKVTTFKRNLEEETIELLLKHINKPKECIQKVLFNLKKDITLKTMHSVMLNTQKLGNLAAKEFIKSLTTQDSAEERAELENVLLLVSEETRAYLLNEEKEKAIIISEFLELYKDFIQEILSGPDTLNEEGVLNFLETFKEQGDHAITAGFFKP